MRYNDQEILAQAEKGLYPVFDGLPAEGAAIIGYANTALSAHGLALDTLPPDMRFRMIYDHIEVTDPNGQYSATGSRYSLITCYVPSKLC